jgi:hypothetical protein
MRLRQEHLRGQTFEAFRIKPPEKRRVKRWPLPLSPRDIAPKGLWLISCETADRLTTVVRANQRRMLRIRACVRKSRLQYGLICSALSFAVAGCSSMPPFNAPVNERTGYPTVSQVVDKIECEIAAAKADPTINSPWVKEHFARKDPPVAPFDQWIANASVALTVESTEGITPNGGLALSVIDPLKVAATSTFGFGGNPILYQQRQRKFTVNYSIDIAKIDPTHCANKKWHAYNLEGDLGLREQIYAGLHSIVQSQSDDFDTSSKTGSSPEAFGATISFDIFKGVSNLGPTWTLARFKGPTGGLGLLREDNDSVVISFVPPTKSKSDAKETARNYTSDLIQRSQLSAINNTLNRM